MQKYFVEVCRRERSLYFGISLDLFMAVRIILKPQLLIHEQDIQFGAMKTPPRSYAQDTVKWQRGDGSESCKMK